jgi:hypothetical protein
MTKHSNDISIDDAKAALGSIAAANRVAYESVNPPLWLRVILALLLGALTVFAAWSSGSSLWTFVTLVTLAIIMVIVLSYYWILRNKGIKLLLKQKNNREKITSFVASFITALILMVSIELYRDGYFWVPFFAAVCNVSVMLYLMSQYSINGAKIKQGE